MIELLCFIHHIKFQYGCSLICFALFALQQQQQQPVINPGQVKRWGTTTED